MLEKCKIIVEKIINKLINALYIIFYILKRGEDQMGRIIDHHKII
jgi:hypothetical protein